MHGIIVCEDRDNETTYLHKVMNALQVGQIIISDVHTNTEVQPSVPPVDNFEVSELKREKTQITTRSFFI